MTINEMSTFEMWKAMEIYGKEVLGYDYMREYTPAQVFERVYNTGMEFDLEHGRCYQPEDLYTFEDIMKIGSFEMVQTALDYAEATHGSMPFAEYLEMQRNTTDEDIFNSEGELVTLY